MSKMTKKRGRNKTSRLFTYVCYICAIAVLSCVGYTLFTPIANSAAQPREVELNSPVVMVGAQGAEGQAAKAAAMSEPAQEPISTRRYEAAAVAETAAGPAVAELAPEENVLYCQYFEPEIKNEDYLLFPNIGGSYYSATVDTYNPDLDYSESIGDVEYTYVTSPIFTIQNQTMYTDSKVVAYEDADENSGTLKTFKSGAKVLCIAVCEAENWAMVDCDGIPGYVEYARLTTTPPAPTPTPAPNPAESEAASPTKMPEKDADANGGEGQELVTSSSRKIRNCEYYGELAGMEIYIDPAVQKSIAKLYIEQVENLPSALQNTGARTMIITTEDIKSILPSLNRLSARVLGCTETGNRYIYINGNLFSKNTVLHEMLHAWDYFKMGAISSSQEFQGIYEREWTTVSVSPGNDQYPREFLASSGEIYFNDPDKLARIAPLTYSFFARYLG